MRLGVTFSVLLLAGAANANTGFGGLTATGLEFRQTEAVVMLEEDLRIGLDRITVEHVFRNPSDKDVTGEVIFPLPPVTGFDVSHHFRAVDAVPDDFVDLTVSAGGKPVEVEIDRIAVILPDWDEDTGLSQIYDTPGKDVTTDLARFGIPLTLDQGRVDAALLALTPEQRREAAGLGLVDAGFSEASRADPAGGSSKWALVTRYHWTQTFPAGAEVRISLSYRNLPAGVLFGWEHPPQDEVSRYHASRYCIDDDTSQAIVETLAMDTGGPPASVGVAYYTFYILRTANSWAGPIGRFRLTIDKGQPTNVMAICADGLIQSGPATYVLERSDYIPEQDLEILFVTPLRFD